VAGKEIAVKKYVVKLSADERDQLEALIRACKGPAQLLTRARIPAAEACRLAKRFEWHYTPKHGSWLDIGPNPSSAFCQANV
jgi:hypothetical protein